MHQSVRCDIVPCRAAVDAPLCAQTAYLILSMHTADEAYKQSHNQSCRKITQISQAFFLLIFFFLSTVRTVERLFSFKFLSFALALTIHNKQQFSSRFIDS
jgi:hypothetical protein